MQSVNGKSAASITLTAADVNAMPTSGGAFTGDFSLNGSAGAYRQWSLDVAGVKRWTFQKDDAPEPGDGSGSNFRVSSRNDDGTFRSTLIYGDRGTGQVAIGTTIPLGNARSTTAGAVAVKDVSTDPAAASGGAYFYSKSGKAFVRQGDGTVLQLDSLTAGPKNTWTPQALGFQAWSVDPASVAAPTLGRAVTIGRTYYAGIYITEPTTVGKVVVLAAGWAGSATIPAARFFTGIYNEAGARVAHSGTTALSNIEAAGQTSGTPTSVKNSHAGAIAFPLSTAVTLQPGRYWASWQMSAGQATDLYYFHVQNESGTNPSIFNLLPTAFVRNAYIEGLSGVPTSINKANMLVNHDQMIMALAL
ncbi:hypothetical protein [Streptomyces niveus]|uniref:hypothetical protein n=1 Tax=Streptomyces niveus TaxID=193462 RepID=UPI0035DCF20B